MANGDNAPLPSDAGAKHGVQEITVAPLARARTSGFTYRAFQDGSAPQRRSELGCGQETLPKLVSRISCPQICPELGISDPAAPALARMVAREVALLQGFGTIVRKGSTVRVRHRAQSRSRKRKGLFAPSALGLR